MAKIKIVPGFDGDPDEVIRERLTPKALEKLYQALDSDNPRVVDHAIAKVIEVDKRLARKDQQPAGGNINILAFNPEHLKSIVGGLKTMFGRELEAPKEP